MPKRELPPGYERHPLDSNLVRKLPTNLIANDTRGSVSPLGGQAKPSADQNKKLPNTVTNY